MRSNKTGIELQRGYKGRGCLVYASLILCVGEFGGDWGGRVDHVKAFYPRQLVLSRFKRALDIRLLGNCILKYTQYGFIGDK